MLDIVCLYIAAPRPPLPALVSCGSRGDTEPRQKPRHPPKARATAALAVPAALYLRTSWVRDEEDSTPPPLPSTTTMDTWARPRGGTYYNEFCGNGWTFRGNNKNWGYKRVAYYSPENPGLRHLLLGPETPAEVGAPSPASRLSLRNNAGSLVVAVTSCISTVFLA